MKVAEKIVKPIIDGAAREGFGGALSGAKVQGLDGGLYGYCHILPHRSVVENVRWVNPCAILPRTNDKYSGLALTNMPIKTV